MVFDLLWMMLNETFCGLFLHEKMHKIIYGFGSLCHKFKIIE